MKVFFHHLQKTGGTTINEMLVKVLGRHQVTPVNLPESQFASVLGRYGHLAAIATSPGAST